MRALKIIALVSVIALCLSVSIGIVAVIYFNTSWLRNEIYLSCTAEANADYAGGFNWTLIIDKRDNKVMWEGFGNNAKARTTEYLTASALRMKWDNDEGKKVTMHLNRLDGRFQMERPEEKSVPKLSGYCYERLPEF